MAMQPYCAAAVSFIVYDAEPQATRNITDIGSSSWRTFRIVRRTSGNGLSTKNLLRCSTSFTLP